MGSARANTDIDPCGTADESTTPVNPALGFQVGSGPAALQCGSKETNFPLIIPEDVPVKAPDAGEVDPAFNTGFPYMIGPDGSEVSYTAITADGILKTFLESLAGSLSEMRSRATCSRRKARPRRPERPSQMRLSACSRR